MLKRNFLVIFFMMILLISCTSQGGDSFKGNDSATEGDYEEYFNKMISDSTIDINANENWNTISPYIEDLGKPISEIAEDYMDWKSIGWAIGCNGVRFRNLHTEMIYAFAPDEFGDLISDDPKNYNLVLRGTEVCFAVGSEISCFFPEFKPTTSRGETERYLKEVLGFNKALFEYSITDDGDYIFTLLGNRLVVEVYCSFQSNGSLSPDSWFEVSRMDDSVFERIKEGRRHWYSGDR